MGERAEDYIFILERKGSVFMYNEQENNYKAEGNYSGASYTAGNTYTNSNYNNDYSSNN